MIYLFLIPYNIIIKILHCFNWNVVLNIATIAAPIIIAIYSQKYAEKQDKKILEDNSINRIAKCQSILSFNNLIKFEIMDDSLQNYTEIKSPLLSQKILNNNDNCFGMSIIFSFKNLTDIFPNEVLVHNIQVWDNAFNKKKELEEKHIFIDFYNYREEYKPVSIDKDKNTWANLLCCMAKEELDVFKNHNDDKRYYTIEIDMSVKNVCNIINDCKIRGTFIAVKKEDKSSGNKGGNKLEIELESISTDVFVENVRDGNM